VASTEPIRIAIVGTGNIAGTHARAIAEASEAEADGGQPAAPPATLIAAMDTDASRLDPFCIEFGVPDGYRNLADLLARARPDLVHVCTPPAAHYAAALACLHAGASVLVEKPPVISLRELDGLAAAQGPDIRGTSGAPWFATVFQHRFGSGQRRLKALAASGVLGRPLVAVCHTTWFRDQAYFDVPWRGNWDTEGGGPTMGHGIHQMDMLLDVLGDWAEVSALAIEGYLDLRAAVTEKGPQALADFYAAALALTGGHAADWRGRWGSGALAAAELTGAHIDEIGAGVPGHLAAAGLWRIGRPAGERSYGMCGRLTTYPAAAAVRVG
jgi:predicted dehydrogenase